MSTSSSPKVDEEPSVSELINGIVGDIQDLGMQHLTLFCNEVRQDLRKATSVMLSVAIGVAIAQIGVLLLCLTFVHLLAQLFPTMPLWIGYGIVGAVVLGLGSIAIRSGVARLQALDVISDNATQAMKEDGKWLTKAN